MQRILFLNLNRAYMNPTPSLVPTLLRKTGVQLSLYGPGYQSLSVLKRGLDRFVDVNGPYDFVVAGEFCTTTPLSPSFENFFLTHKYLYGEHTIDTLRDMARWYKTYQGLRVILLVETDGFNMRPEQAAFLEEHADMVGVLWDANLMESIHESMDLMLEPYASKATDVFFDFLCRNHHRTIALPHWVAASEFNWAPVLDRPCKLAIPGAPYIYRERARKIAAQHGFLHRAFPWMKIYSLANRLGLPMYDHWASLSLYQAQFIRQLEQSRYIYTCGSAQKMHIRKHIEIPARGALMITAPLVGLERLGFQDEENCLVRMPEQLPDTIARLRAEPDMVERIATAGQTLIWDWHRTESRAAQLRSCFISLQGGTFYGSSWEDGRWVVEERVSHG